ncbi:butyrophilin subfamily 2 member A2-like [Trachemys scripta elegans]|uniref:butyrophilin subfamily 2 member A2-like n=1 Tax=Trachemys scripta elegans TaxID=31138 RepID=UPI00155549C0|nr:butyrophilin subfamily 2 member A2-like [Trachemys scripta elegans]
MAVVAAFLRRQGIQVFPYLDDWLIKGRTKALVEAQVVFIRHTFSSLGLLINKAKSTLSPTQRIEFIGALLDSTQARVYLPEARFRTLSNIILGLQSYPTTTVRSCLKLLGHMAAPNVTLDPDTAHRDLVLSKDQKSVRWGDTRPDLPNNSERFDSVLCVLGCEGFNSGRHCWEVEVGDGQYWAVGVARESVSRKGRIEHNPETGIWAVQLWGDEFRALTSPIILLPLSQVPSRIRVCLDCDQGQVTFFDAGNETLIFTFPPASVPGERIRPWVWLGWRAQLRLCPMWGREYPTVAK